MRNFWKLSSLAAVLLASATYTSAATLTIASGAGTALSHTNGALEFLGYNATPGTGFPSLTFNTIINGAPFVATGSTQNIGTGAGVWAGPLPGSSWVSFANTAPGSGNVAANGSYVYHTTFDTTSLGNGVTYSGFGSILADDTVSVFLNGTLLPNEELIASPVGADGHCSSGVPSCTDPAGTAFTNSSLIKFGVNDLYFVVQQTGLSAEGLDFSATVTAVPEPNTLLMLGTGLIGSAGALFRRMRK